jgi:hypothetical protein
VCSCAFVASTFFFLGVAGERVSLATCTFLWIYREMHPKKYCCINSRKWGVDNTEHHHPRSHTHAQNNTNSPSF